MAFFQKLALNHDLFLSPGRDNYSKTHVARERKTLCLTIYVIFGVSPSLPKVSFDSDLNRTIFSKIKRGKIKK